MVQFRILLLLPLLLVGCGSKNLISNTSDNKQVSASIKAEVAHSDIVQFILADPEITRLKLGVERSEIERRLMRASLEPQVSASSNLGAGASNGELKPAGTIQVGLSKDADLSGTSLSRLGIIDKQEQIASKSILEIVNNRLFSILNAMISIEAMDEKIKLIDDGLDEYQGVKGLIETSQRMGVISKGRVLEINNQVTEVKLLRSQFELTKDTAQTTLDLELRNTNPSVINKLKNSSNTIIDQKIESDLDQVVYELNELNLGILEDNLQIEQNSSQWNGSYAASITSTEGEEASGFLGIQLIRPVYDAGQSEIRQELIKNQMEQTSLELSELEKKVRIAYQSLNKAEETLKRQVQLNSEKLDNLIQAQKELEVRKAAGKANLEDQAQSIVDVANAEIKLIDLNFEYEKAKLEFLLLNQTLYRLVLSDDDVKQLLN